jgi:hypothetical protein
MNRKMPLLSALILFGISLSACSDADHEQAAADSVSAADTAAAAPVTVGNEAVPALNSPERKLIHTATMHAEVKDLYAATSSIESATLRLGGQVSNSTMHKELLEIKERRAGSDSLTSFRRYQGVAQLGLRVPVARLDTLMRVIAAQADFIDNRQLHIDDATYRYLANTMRNKQLSGSETTVAGVAKRDGLEARQYLDRQRGQSIDRQVDNLQAADQAAFASLSVDLTQPEELIAAKHADLAHAMQPGAGQRFLLSLRNGWEILYDLVLAVLGIWPLCLLAGFGIRIARRWYRRQQSGSRVS